MKNGTRRVSAGWAFVGGGLAAFVASRILPPLIGQLLGSARDPFEALAADHRRVLAVLDKFEATADDQTAARTMLLLKIKRNLTAHALAEEDVVYPVLKMQAEEVDAAEQLYREHAEIKMHLHKMEAMPKGDPSFRETARSLRDLIARHARLEEEVEFPKLRRTLDTARTAELAGSVAREKAMVI
jgi:hemerythrin superfamily protein